MPRLGLLLFLLLLAGPSWVPSWVPSSGSGCADARRSKAKAAKKTQSGAMQAARQAGQRLIAAMTGRGRGAARPDELLAQAVSAYEAALQEEGCNQTEAWHQIGFLQKGFYQETASRFKQQGMADARGVLTPHRAGAFRAYRHLVSEVDPGCLSGWEGLASVHDDMAVAGEASWAEAVSTYGRALEVHHTWVRGVRRAAEIVLTQEQVGEYGDADALEKMDEFIDLVQKQSSHFRVLCDAGAQISNSASSTRSATVRPMQCQHFNMQWIFRAASSMHAQAGNLARALQIQGLSCSMDSCPDGSFPLDSASILPHYNKPLGLAKDASDEDGADVAVFESAVSADVFARLVHGFRLGSQYWGQAGSGYQGDFESHWYSLKDQPTNAIHQALQQMAMRIPASDRPKITGVEWW